MQNTTKANNNALRITWIAEADRSPELAAFAADSRLFLAAFHELLEAGGVWDEPTFERSTAHHSRGRDVLTLRAATGKTRTEQAKVIGHPVGATILEQLGGKRFIAMTGAKNFGADGTTLAFRIPKAKHSINHVRVTLTPMDDYTMVFSRIRAGKETIVEEVSSAYCDTLQKIFTEITRLDTRVS